MNSINRPGSSPTELNYYSLVKSGVTTLALMTLTYGAMKGVERYTKRTFTPFQRNVAGIVLTTVYLAAAARFGGPFTKKIDPSSSPKGGGAQPLSLQRDGAIESPLPIVPAVRQSEARRALRSREVSLVLNNLRDFTPADLKKVQDALITFQKRIRRNGCRYVDCKFLFNGRVQYIYCDISTREKQLQALLVCNRLQRFIGGVQSRAQLEAPQRVESSRVLELSQVHESFVMVPNLARPDLTMSVNPARYDEQVHGVNGCRMKQNLFKSLLNEYIHLLKEEFGIDAALRYRQLAKTSWCYRKPHETHMMWMLYYLTEPGSEKSMVGAIGGLTGLGVTGDEARYWKFIGAHRTLMDDYQGKEATYNTEALELGRALAYIRMVPRIQAYQESLVQAHYEGPLPAMTAKTFHQAFAMRNEVLRSADSRMKLWKVWSNTAKLQGATSFCDYFGVNPPNLRKIETWTDGKTRRRIFYLRHSTPHAGAAISKAPIDLAYREFLRYAQAKGEGVLYGAHQRLGDFGVKFEQEGYRCQSIVDLEKDHPNLILLFQSVESELFKKGAQTFTALKEAIIDSFKQKEGPRRNRLPHFLVTDQGESLAIKPAYEGELRAILDGIQKLFFPRENDEINQDKVDYYGGLTEGAHLATESQAFIMLFYHFQREHLKHADLSQYGYGWRVTYVNTGCKDDYDRGLGQNLTSDRVHHHQVHGANVPQADLEASLSSGQAPPIQGKGVPVIKYRVHPALLVSAILAALNTAQLKALQSIKWNDWSIESYDVPRRVGQTAF